MQILSSLPLNVIGVDYTVGETKPRHTRESPVQGKPAPQIELSITRMNIATG